MDHKRTYRIILSGGGTGGHIYPAIAVADKAMEMFPGSEVLFVGANGKMEMEKVPQAGYRIRGLPVTGLHRKFTARNLVFPFRLAASLTGAKKIINDFNPDAVAGFGGYASAPLLWVASGRKIPSIIQEQNSYAGLANKLLSRRVSRICVAYEGMEKYFPGEKILITGNPVRNDIFEDPVPKKIKAFRHFGLEAGRKVILAIGGSLGAGTINRSLFGSLHLFMRHGVQLLWQVGKLYMPEYTDKLKNMDIPGIHPLEFIREMDLAYAAADLVIARAGALTISELCAAGKPSVLVPSPNVAEDHQTKNARHLAGKGAAVMVRDQEAPEKLADLALELVQQESRLKELSVNIRGLSRRNAAEEIVKTLTGLLN